MNKQKGKRAIANATFQINKYDPRFKDGIGVPIVGAVVNLAGQTQYTDNFGKCRFAGILVGDYSLIINHPDYETYEDTVSFHPKKKKRGEG
jgi:hypothetical protein